MPQSKVTSLYCYYRQIVGKKVTKQFSIIHYLKAYFHCNLSHNNHQRSRYEQAYNLFLVMLYLANFRPKIWIKRRVEKGSLFSIFNHFWGLVLWNANYDFAGHIGIWTCVGIQNVSQMQYKGIQDDRFSNIYWGIFYLLCFQSYVLVFLNYVFAN